MQERNELAFVFFTLNTTDLEHSTVLVVAFPFTNTANSCVVLRRWTAFSAPVDVDSAKIVTPA